MAYYSHKNHTMKRLKLSDNRRFFVYEDGTPFPWLADTAWTLPQRMKWDDADYYMQKRKSQGFTVLQIVALDPERDEEIKNPAGEFALFNQNLDTPNERYFLYLDWLLDKAEEYEFYVLLLPVWGQLVVGSNWSGEQFTKTVTEKNAYRFGRWIGERYHNRTNILWCLGGDRHPIHLGNDYRNVWRRMAEGLAKGVLSKDLKYNEPDPAWDDLLITYHPCFESSTGECSTMSYWTDEDQWIRYTMLQSGHRSNPKNYELVTKEYIKNNVRPVWDGEPAYEMMPIEWPFTESTPCHGSWMVRKRAYWALFSGAFGHTYGHASVWSFISEKERSLYGRYSWYNALDAEGAQQMLYLRFLLDSLHIMRCIPRTDILTKCQKDNLDHHLQVCADPDSKFLCVYFPSGGSAEIAVTKFWHSSASASQALNLWLWWYNPRNGKFYANKGEHTVIHGTKQKIAEGSLYISAPDSGKEHDWVLIIMNEETVPPIKKQVYHQINGWKNTEGKKVFEW